MSLPVPLNALRAFEAAARLGGISLAARELGVTPGAVSQQVKALEQRLGLALLRRTADGVALTDEGQKILPRLSAAFDEINAALGDLLIDDAPLRVAATPSFGTRWLAGRLTDFRARNPAWSVQLVADERAVDFEREGFDLGVRLAVVPGPELFAEKLFTPVVLPVCVPDVAARLSNPADLLRETLFEVNGYRDDWDQWLVLAGIQQARQAAREVHSNESMVIEAALAGGGVALVQPYLVRDLVASGRLAQPFEQALTCKKPYWLVSSKAKARRPKMRAFRDWLRAKLAEDAQIAALMG